MPFIYSSNENTPSFPPETLSKVEQIIMQTATLEKLTARSNKISNTVKPALVTTSVKLQ
jgi:hypothetical protein